MKNTKKNNKGFSLVELIVVVLIMAIIGVALAPQVMKWVDKSRQATDQQNYESLLANCQLALTDKAAYDELKNQTITLTVTSGADVAITPSTATVTAFTAAMNGLDSSWSKLRAKVSSGSYTIVITNAVVSAGTKPTLDSDLQ